MASNNRQSAKYNSNLSEFVRNASSTRKKKIYTRVIQKAIESQKLIVKKAELLRAESDS